MAYTAAQLASKVAIKIGFLTPGATLATADQTIITDAYAALYDTLQREHKVDWGPDDSIPVWAMLPIRDILASRVANDFGKPRNLDDETMGFRELSKGLAVDNSQDPTEINAY